MSDVVVLALVLLLVASGYAAGRVHGQVGYRDGYRGGYRQGYVDGVRARPPQVGAPEPAAAPEVEVIDSDDHEPSETRHFRTAVRAAAQRVRHGRA